MLAVLFHSKCHQIVQLPGVKPLDPRGTPEWAFGLTHASKLMQVMPFDFDNEGPDKGKCGTDCKSTLQLLASVTVASAYPHITLNGSHSGTA